MLGDSCILLVLFRKIELYKKEKRNICNKP